MDLRQLRSFVAIATHRTFARAAEVVYLTPSAVGQQIKALEEELGVPLFDRTSRPPELTPNGHQVLEMARSILEIEEQTVASIKGKKISGTLSLGTVRSSALDLLPKAIKLMNERYPDLKINLHVSLSTNLIADVAAGRIDAAVVAEHLAIPPTLRWSPFLKEPLWLIAPPGYEGQFVKEALEINPFIRFKSAVPLAQLIDTEISRLGVFTNDIAEIDTITSIVTCVQQGLGVSVVPHVAIQNDNTCVRIPFGEPQLTRQIGLVERISSTRSVIIQELHNLLATDSYPFGVSRKSMVGPSPKSLT